MSVQPKCLLSFRRQHEHAVFQVKFQSDLREVSKFKVLPECLVIAVSQANQFGAAVVVYFESPNLEIAEHLVILASRLMTADGVDQPIRSGVVREKFHAIRVAQAKPVFVVAIGASEFV